MDTMLVVSVFCVSLHSNHPSGTGCYNVYLPNCAWQHIQQACNWPWYACGGQDQPLRRLRQFLNNCRNCNRFWCGRLEPHLIEPYFSRPFACRPVHSWHRCHCLGRPVPGVYRPSLSVSISLCRRGWSSKCTWRHGFRRPLCPGHQSRGLANHPSPLSHFHTLLSSFTKRPLVSIKSQKLQEITR